METDRLRYFCAIAETGSLTAASGILNVSHSGLSKAMAVLQTELKQQLFRPLGRGLELTDAGRDIYQNAKEIIRQIDNLKKLKPLHEGSVIRIGMAEIFVLILAGPLAAELKTAGLTADFYELDSGDAEAMVRDGRMDFALTFVPFPQSDLEYLKIKTVTMGIFGKNSKFQQMPLEQIPFVVPNHALTQNPLSLKSRDGWPVEIPRNVQYGASSLTLALKIVEEGLAAVFMPKFLNDGQYFDYHPGLVKRSHVHRDLFILKRKNSEESKAMKLAAKAMRRLC